MSRPPCLVGALRCHRTYLFERFKGGRSARTCCCIWSFNHVRACRHTAAYSGCHSATCSTATAPAPTVASASFSRIRPSRLSRRFSLLRSSSPAIPPFPYVPRSCSPLPSTTSHIVRRKGEWWGGGHRRRELRCPCHAAGSPIIQVIAARNQCATGYVTDFPRIDHSVHSVSAMQVSTANCDQTLRLNPFVSVASLCCRCPQLSYHPKVEGVWLGLLHLHLPLLHFRGV